MPAEKMRLTDAMDGYLGWRRASGRARATITNEEQVLRRFLRINGDLFVTSLGDRHVDNHLSAASVTRTERSLGVDYATLRTFFGWCVRQRQIKDRDNPMKGRKTPRFMPREKIRVPVEKFPALLDAAERRHPRNRMVVALGLYLYPRASEVADMRIRDPHLSDMEISVRIWKTKKIDQLPVCLELDGEVRRWLRFYTEEVGPLEPDWFLVPAFKPGMAYYDRTRQRLVNVDSDKRLNPTRKISRMADIVKLALGDIGFECRDDSGASLFEGFHTLRRSGARAGYDALAKQGHDGAIRHIQTMLNHDNMAQTEQYIGLTLDKARRNEIVKGRMMFDIDNVVQLRGVSSGQGERDSV